MIFFNDIWLSAQHRLITEIETTQLTKDSETLNSFVLDFNNIMKVNILKSKETGLTSVEAHLELLTELQAMAITSGAYTFQLIISSGSIKEKDSPNLTSNFFVVTDFQIIESNTNDNPLRQKSNSMKITLNSWTTVRMSEENNFGFLNWGSSTVDSGTASPKKMLLEKIQSDYMETYGGITAETQTNSTTAAAGVNEAGLFNIISYSGSDILEVKSPPVNGYTLAGENNLEIISRFLSTYPPILTPFKWAFEDLAPLTMGTTRLYVTDLFSTSSWPVSKTLGKLFDGSNKELFAYTKLALIESKTFFDNLRFQVGSQQPVIQIVQSATAIPMILDASKINAEVTVHTSNGESFLGKQIKNPKIKTVYTFMTEQDVAAREIYQRRLKSQKPMLETFRIENLSYDMVDFNSAIKFPMGLGSEKAAPRIGIGYAFKYTFVRYKKPTQDLPKDSTEGSLLGDSSEEKTFQMVVDAQYFIINDNNDSPEYLKLDTTEVDAIVSQMTKIDASVVANGSMTYNGYGPASTNVTAEYGSLNLNGTAGDILSYAEKLIQTGFKYVWGGASPSQGGYDCSGFVMTAVCAATGLKTFGSPTSKDAFPRTAANQHMWCKKYAQPVEYDKAEPGDIIFISKDGKSSNHVGICKSNEEVYAASSAVQPSRSASTCTASNPCKGAVTQPRHTSGKTSSWDKKLLGIFRLHGTSSNVGAGAGVFCKQIASIESSGLPKGTPSGYDAFNSGSKAQGAYQFVPKTAEEVQKAIGTWGKPDAWSKENQDKMCAYYEKTVTSILKKAGIPLTLRNVYLGWQQGGTGAKAILSAFATGTEVQDPTYVKNMKSNMHYGTYTGVSSYIADYDRFLRDKGVDPTQSYG